MIQQMNNVVAVGFKNIDRSSTQLFRLVVEATIGGNLLGWVLEQLKLVPKHQVINGVVPSVILDLNSAGQEVSDDFLMMLSNLVLSVDLGVELVGLGCDDCCNLSLDVINDVCAKLEIKMVPSSELSQPSYSAFHLAQKSPKLWSARAQQSVMLAWANSRESLSVSALLKKQLQPSLNFYFLINFFFSIWLYSRCHQNSRDWLYRCADDDCSQWMFHYLYGLSRNNMALSSVLVDPNELLLSSFGLFSHYCALQQGQKVYRFESGYVSLLGN